MITKYLGWVKRNIFRLERPYKHLIREITKDAVRDQKRLLSSNPVRVEFDIGANIGQTNSQVCQSLS
jgi:hypothetical protein